MHTFLLFYIIFFLFLISDKVIETTETGCLTKHIAVKAVVEKIFHALHRITQNEYYVILKVFKNTLFFQKCCRRLQINVQKKMACKTNDRIIKKFINLN